MAKPPHLPALPAQYEKKPDKIMPEWFRPLDGVQYKVQDGDSLAGIAAKTGYPAKSLLQYSFQTADPREVNWYLRNRVGCKEYGPNVKNFAFSTSADPGLIWLPANVYRKLTAKPKAPPHTYTVPGVMPRYIQKSSNVCWGAAVANVYDWKKRTRRTATKALGEIGWDWQLLYSAGNYLQGPQFKELAGDAGLRKVELGSFLDDDVWMKTIKKRGALLMLQKAYGMWTHWIVLTGYEVDADHKLWIDYVDPADGRKYGESADALYSKCLDAPTQYPRVWGY